MELHSKLRDWFLYDRDLRHERVDQSDIRLFSQVHKKIAYDFSLNFVCRLKTIKEILFVRYV